MRTAVVTGATGSIGAAVVQRLLAQTYQVHVIGTDPDRLLALCMQKPDWVHPHAVDLADDAAIGRWCTAFGDQPLDLLVHGAGTLTLDPIETASLPAFDYHYRVNVRAPFQLTQALLPNLRAAQGDIVLLNSTVGLRASANGSQYGASKHALRAFADSLRDEVNGDGIRVLSMFLGRTSSRMQEAVCKREGKPYDPNSLIQPSDVAQMLISTLHLPRTAELTDLSIRPCRKPRCA